MKIGPAFIDRDTRRAGARPPSFELWATPPKLPIRTRMSLDWHGMAIFGLVAVLILFILVRLLLRG